MLKWCFYSFIIFSPNCVVKIFLFVIQGEAKSAQLIGEAISNNPAFITLRRIEASKEIAHILAASTNKVYLDSNELLLNLHGLNKESGKK